MSKTERARRVSRAKSILRPDQKVEPVSIPALPSVAEDRRSRRGGPSRSISRPKTTSAGAFDCECGPDLYTAVLGPTADEAILGGARAIINICRRFTACDDEDDEEDSEGDSVANHTGKSVTKKSGSFETAPAPEVVSKILESVGLPSDVASRIVQTSFAELEEKKPSLASKLQQTSTPEMISQILQTMGLSPETASQIVQTSLETLIRQDPIMASKLLQTSAPELKSGMMQTNPPPSLTSVFMQTSLQEVPSAELKTEPPQIPSKSEEPVASKMSTEEPKEPSAVKIFSRSREPLRTSEPDVPEEVRLKEPPRTSHHSAGDVKAKSGSKIKTSSSKWKDAPPEAPERRRMCVCCKCVVPEEEEECEELVETSSMSVADRIKENEEKLSRHEPVKTVRICKCLEYSSSVSRRGSKAKHRCACYSGPRRSKHTYARGDTYCSTEPSCCCDSDYCRSKQ